MAGVVLRFDAEREVFDGLCINAESDMEARAVEYALARYGLTHLLEDAGRDKSDTGEGLCSK